jgi:AbrB family looped-hinge helix DNA binding protein
MSQLSVKVDQAGRVVIPRDVRVALGIPDGGELRLTVLDGELRATSRATALRRIWAETARLGDAGGPATEALLADRRAEARRGLHEEQAPPPGG